MAATAVRLAINIAPYYRGMRGVHGCKITGWRDRRKICCAARGRRAASFVGVAAMRAHPNRSKRQQVSKAIDLLARARHCEGRAHSAYIRAGRHPGTTTMDREMELSGRWSDKADRAWDEAMGILETMAGPDPCYARGGD